MTSAAEARGSRGALQLAMLDHRAQDYREYGQCQGPLFEEWLAAWQRLDDTEKDAFTNPVWTASWLASYAAESPERFCIFTVREAGTLVGLLPFRIESGRSLLGGACWLAHPENPQTGGASLALPAGYHRAVLEGILDFEVRPGRRPRMLRFGKVDATNALLRAGLPARCLETRSRAVIEMPDGYEALRKGLSRRFKNALRTSLNHLKRLPDVRFDEYTRPPEILDAFEEHVKLEARGWKGRQGEKDKREAGEAIAAVPARYRYYASAVPNLARRTGAAIHMLRIEGKPVASLFSFRHGKTLFIVRITYDEGFPKISPGHTLLAHVLDQYCPEHGMVRINGIGSPVWLDRWQPRREPVFDVRIFPGGLRGRWARIVMIGPRERLTGVLERFGLMKAARRFLRTGSPT